MSVFDMLKHHSMEHVKQLSLATRRKHVAAILVLFATPSLDTSNVSD